MAVGFLVMLEAFPLAYGTGFFGTGGFDFSQLAYGTNTLIL
jgi:hypothetical protein